MSWKLGYKNMCGQRCGPHYCQCSTGHDDDKKFVNVAISDAVHFIQFRVGLTPNYFHYREVAFLHVNVNKVHLLELLSVTVGWMYFLAWSVSFYPQVYINYTRKRQHKLSNRKDPLLPQYTSVYCFYSVVGLNFDFLALNIVGFIMYSLFNCGMYFLPSIQVCRRISYPVYIDFT